LIRHQELELPDSPQRIVSEPRDNTWSSREKLDHIELWLGERATETVLSARHCAKRPEGDQRSCLDTQLQSLSFSLSCEFSPSERIQTKSNLLFQPGFPLFSPNSSLYLVSGSIPCYLSVTLTNIPPGFSPAVGADFRLPRSRSPRTKDARLRWALSQASPVSRVNQRGHQIPSLTCFYFESVSARMWRM